LPPSRLCPSASVNYFICGSPTPDRTAIEEREQAMDLNYLFHRQQVERSLAQAAASEAARRIHQELAEEYERQIVAVSGGKVSFLGGELRTG
jgi:hypothetical protein